METTGAGPSTSTRGIIEPVTVTPFSSTALSALVDNGASGWALDDACCAKACGVKSANARELASTLRRKQLLFMVILPASLSDCLLVCALLTYTRGGPR